jgi:hypothetical protein
MDNLEFIDLQLELLRLKKNRCTSNYLNETRWYKKIIVKRVKNLRKQINEIKKKNPVMFDYFKYSNIESKPKRQYERHEISIEDEQNIQSTKNMLMKNFKKQSESFSDLDRQKFIDDSTRQLKYILKRLRFKAMQK